MKRIILVALFCSLSCGLAVASEDDLTKAKSAFAEADRVLNQEYQETRKALRESDFQELKQEQRAWLRFRDDRSKVAVAYDDRDVPTDQAKTSPTFWNMMAHLTSNRTEMIRGWRDKRRWDDPLTGRYADDYGGSMLLFQDGEKLYFLIDVVRGPTYHLGSIAGVAQINGRIARYSDNDTDRKKKETWITFITGGRRIELITANTQYYHGARAYFDGKYLRVADLTAEQKRAVLEGEIRP